MKKGLIVLLACAVCLAGCSKSNKDETTAAATSAASTTSGASATSGASETSSTEVSTNGPEEETAVASEEFAEYPTDASTEATSTSWMEGVSMYVKSVEDGVVTLAFYNDTDKNIETNEPYQIYSRIPEGYKKTDVLEGVTPAFNSLATLVDPGVLTYMDEKYTDIYGDLPYGEYRIGKEIRDVRAPAEYDTYSYFTGFVIGDQSYGIDYGHSNIYTQEDMEAAVFKILTSFDEMDALGCKIHNIRYASDDCYNDADLDWMNELAPEGTTYTQCIEFFMDFHTPAENSGAFNPDMEYIDFNWWLARTDGGDWELVTQGY